MMVSFVRRCYETETRPISLDDVFLAIKTGAHGLKEKVHQIRNNYEFELALTNDPQKAKKAIAELKNELPGWLPSGVFAKRDNASLVAFSGLLMGDLDDVGEAGPTLKEFFKTSPFVRACMISPSGHGVKILANVPPDPDRFEDCFRAFKQYVLSWTGFELDEKRKDIAGICYFTHDPDLWVRTEGNETISPVDPIQPPVAAMTSNPADLTLREQIAFNLLGSLKYDSGKRGYFCRCPSEGLHTTKTADKHTILFLETVPTLVCQHESCSATIEAFNKVLRSEIGKAESRVSYPHYRDVRSETLGDNGAQRAQPVLDKPLIRFYSPDELKAYVPPPDIQLIGDYHIVRDTGFVAVIGGPPGVGKSLTTNYLAMAGAKGEGDWFGLTVHRRFKTMIIQTENGLFRLSENFKSFDCDNLNDYVRVCDPPPMGLQFRQKDFHLLISSEIAKFAPDMVILDPLNSVARDQEQRTYLDTIDLIKSILPVNTVLVIIAHTRKPQTNERASGRALMHLLAGSHVLVSVPRTVFVLQYGSDDTEDDTVVWTCCKNNDGELGKRTAWHRQAGLFVPEPNFDWASFDAEDKDKRIVITEDMVAEVFEKGPLIRTLARDKLLEISGASKAAVYKALSTKGRFSDNLFFKDDVINYVK